MSTLCNTVNTITTTATADDVVPCGNLFADLEIKDPFDIMHSPFKVARFEFVSEDQYEKDVDSLLFHPNVEYINDHIENCLPTRSTEFSAGYDFVSPMSFKLGPGEQIVIPTGIRCKMQGNTVLCIYPRSSIGIKNGIMLANTIPVIDADYYNAKNEGHILLAFKNTNKKSWLSSRNKKNTWFVTAGDRICQGVFLTYGITVNDSANNKREGGIGSTGA